MREVEVGRAAVAYFRSLGMDVYQEVEGYGGGVSDIVAVANQRITICECKVNLSWDLLAQARRRQPHAHWVWVAVPAGKMTDGRHLAYRTVENWGIGLLLVKAGEAVALHGSKLNRRPIYTADLLERLEPEHRDYAEAGSPGGGRWTPFKRTVRAITDAVKRTPGIPLAKLVKEVRHHYSTDAGARAQIPHWIRKGVIPGIELRRGDRRALLLYPAEVAPKDDPQ